MADQQPRTKTTPKTVDPWVRLLDEDSLARLRAETLPRLAAVTADRLAAAAADTGSVRVGPHRRDDHRGDVDRLLERLDLIRRLA